MEAATERKLLQAAHNVASSRSARTRLRRSWIPIGYIFFNCAVSARVSLHIPLCVLLFYIGCKRVCLSLPWLFYHPCP